MGLIRDWRRGKAEEQGLPVYMVLQQKALNAISSVMPRTFDELKKLSGIGSVTVQRYGKEILDIVADYREANGL